ncbi:hypothetical protein Cabys_363 [Caldithrix abyssi DSM 13497]|uniref:Uncharacterized protein n=1 Tax=Caldithrix abyssi DSM 13497 TaxID=880073 RepID=A0A1J1C534_CALAY|nr:hypothetical protein Cabys_363 [Caldithrix abyssi DSM 13497]
MEIFYNDVQYLRILKFLFNHSTIQLINYSTNTAAQKFSNPAVAGLDLSR